MRRDFGKLPFIQCKTSGFYQVGKTLIISVETHKHPTVQTNACACACACVVVGIINERERETGRERVRGEMVQYCGVFCTNKLSGFLWENSVCACSL